MIAAIRVNDDRGSGSMPSTENVRCFEAVSGGPTMFARIGVKRALNRQ